MKTICRGFAIAAVIMAALLLLPLKSEAKRVLVKVDGSSTVFPITEAVSEEFQMDRANKGIMVTVGISGTGGGFKKFCRSEIDVTNASRPIKSTEIALCGKNGVEYLELPIAFDGIAIIVNKSNSFLKEITVDELKKMWSPEAQRKVLKWSDVNPAWPSTPLRLFGPGVDSGTFDYFTKAINGEEGASRGDFTATEDDNVIVQGVSTDKSALGFLGLAYYEENKNKLKVVPVVATKGVNKGKAVEPNLETVRDNIYTPLSRPIFIYASVKASQKPEVDKFMKYYLKMAGELAEEVGYIPLSETEHGKTLKIYNEKITGTIY